MGTTNHPAPRRALDRESVKPFPAYHLDPKAFYPVNRNPERPPVGITRGQGVARMNKKQKPMTPEQKQARRDARKAARLAAIEKARIDAQKAQKPVSRVIVTLTWNKSRTWGMCPRAEGRIEYKDGTWGHTQRAYASGCGVGMSCYGPIAEYLGGTMDHIADTPTVDVYVFTFKR